MTAPARAVTLATQTPSPAHDLGPHLESPINAAIEATGEPTGETKRLATTRLRAPYWSGDVGSRRSLRSATFEPADVGGLRRGDDASGDTDDDAAWRDVLGDDGLSPDRAVVADGDGSEDD